MGWRVFKKANGHKVSNTGYILYCNGNSYEEQFASKIEFRMTLLAYEGDSSWVDDISVRLHECLNSDELPEPVLTNRFLNGTHIFTVITVRLSQRLSQFQPRK